MSYFFINNNDSALYYINKAYKLNPEVNYEIEYYLARTNHYLNNFSNAIDYYNKFRQKNPTDFVSEKYINECKNGIEIVKDTIQFEVSALNDSVNSIFPDYGAYLSYNDSLIVFTSRRSMGGNQTNELPTDNIYFSVQKDNIFSKSKYISRRINTLGTSVPLKLKEFQ